MMRIVKAAACAVAAWLAASCANVETPRAAAQPPGPIALPNANFEKAYKVTCPPDWSCVSHADPFSFRYYVDETRPGEGKRSICIEPKGREPWGKAVQAMREGPWRGRHVRFSMLVRVENVAHTQEGMGAGVVALAHTSTPSAPVKTKQGMTQVGSVVKSEKLIHGTSDWQRLAVDLEVPENTNVLEVGVALVGSGRVCADDAVLELL